MIRRITTHLAKPFLTIQGKTVLQTVVLTLLLAVFPLTACSSPVDAITGTSPNANSATTATMVGLTTELSTQSTIESTDSATTAELAAYSAAAPKVSSETTAMAAPMPSLTQKPTTTVTSKPTAAITPKPTGVTLETTANITPKPATTTNATTAAAPQLTGSSLKGRLVVLDPGHQSKPDPELEPIAPGSETLKPHTSAGTRGVVTKRPEYEINLEIALKVKARLEAQGCIVRMTRTVNDVQISNIERALFAISFQPDAFLRLHCDYSSKPAFTGVGTFVPITGPYAAQMPEWGQQLAADISAATGAVNRGVIANANYTGLNWADSAPSFLLEMGFMSNADEDRLLCDPIYQHKIAAGIERFVARMPIRDRS